MIPWFFTRDEIQSFANLSLKKKSKKLNELSEQLQMTENLLRDRIKQSRDMAEKAARRLNRGDHEASKDLLNSFSSHIASTQPLMNTYVARKLEFSLFEIMAIEGFEFPSALLELRNDINFGLFAVNSMDELERLLMAESDPFEQLGIDIEESIVSDDSA